MKRLYLTAFTYRDGLGEDDYRALLARFLELGTYPSAVSVYARLDGRGGFLVHESPDDGQAEADFELTLRYNHWAQFETIPITTIEDALPALQRVFG